MTWRTRLKETIELFSPKGQTFNAFWRADPISFGKKLGIFQYPKLSGSVVQDLDITATSYPLTIYFEGPNNDIEAERFLQACKEKGSWVIDHPVKGSGLILILVSVTENVDPTESGNITQFDTDWTDFIPQAVISSTSELGSTIDAQNDQLNGSAADQFTKIKQDKFSFVQAVKNTSEQIVAFSNNALEPLFTLSSEVNSAVNSITRSIQDTLDATVLDPLKLAGQIQNLIQTPALVIDDFTARIDAYVNLANDIFGLDPDNATTENFNVASTQELALSAIIGTSSIIASTSDFQTRNQVLTAIDDSASLFNTITNNLDNSQALFDGLTIDNQYFSQSNSFPDAAFITAQAAQLLLRKLFDLAVEKRIVLDRPRSPIDVTISEYGSLGDNDILLDLFIASNNLKNLDILLLKSGTEVVVYV